MTTTSYNTTRDPILQAECARLVDDGVGYANASVRAFGGAARLSLLNGDTEMADRLSALALEIRSLVRALQLGDVE